ncbi:MAG: TadE/TadG family type IV pilus assembly protein [Nocardioidaceae bacterium]
MRARLRLRRRDDGAAAVEFALLLVLFVTLLFGLIQYGMYFYSSQTGSSVAGRALREVTVGNCQPSADLQTYITNGLSGAAAGAVTNVTRTYTHTNGTTTTNPALAQVGDQVVLTFTYPDVNLHFPFVPFLSNDTITKSVQGLVEDTASQGCS